MSDTVHPSDRMTIDEISHTGTIIQVLGGAILNATHDLLALNDTSDTDELRQYSVYTFHTRQLSGFGRRQRLEAFSDHPLDYLVWISSAEVAERALRIYALARREIARTEEHPEESPPRWAAIFEHGEFRHFTQPPRLMSATAKLTPARDVSRKHVRQLEQTMRGVLDALHNDRR